MIPEWFPANEVKSLRQFKDFHKLSEGAFGEVYEAVHEAPDLQPAPVVVKRLKPAFAMRDSPPLKSLLNEAQILKTLKHDSFPEYIDGFVSEREGFIIMQKMPGVDLNRLLKNAFLSGRKPSMGLGSLVVLRLLEALDYLHNPSTSPSQEKGAIVHSDLKPPNVLLDPDLRVHLIDFSMSVRLDQPKRFLGGSRGYLPPEYYLEEPVSIQSDLFSAASLFFDLLTLRPLFKDRKNDYVVFIEMLHRSYLDEVRKQHFPSALEAVLLRSLAFRREERFSSAGEFAAALVSASADIGLNLSDEDALRQEYETLRKIS